MSGKRSVGRPANQSTPQHRSYLQQGGPELEDTFRRTLKMLTEHLKRHEAAVFSDEMWDHDKGMGKHSSRLSKECKEIAQALTNLGTMFLRIQKEARAAADLMTLDEKIDAIEALSEELGKLQARKFLGRMYQIVRELEKRHMQPYTASRKQDWSQSLTEVEEAASEFAKPHYPDSHMAPDED